MSLIDDARAAFFADNGYLLVPGLFTADEARDYRDHFMALRADGWYPNDFEGWRDAGDHDPLKRFPRMIQMHRWDAVTKRWLLDRRLAAALTKLFGHEPLAAQTMMYFKPPRSRGQALHQDNFFLRALPGTCMAAWMALDVCDEANGCMRVVPGTHRWDLLCPKEADASVSFTEAEVPVPDDCEAVPVHMMPGDVLFFHGALVHGSLPNDTDDRFRRSLIGHYIDGRAERVNEFNQPLLRMDGTPVWMEPSKGGRPCGVWVERDGTRTIAVSAEAGRNITVSY